jgi:hypothetical protein
MIFLVSTTTGWNQMHLFTDPISIQFWPLHSNLVQHNHLRKHQTQPRLIAPQSSPRAGYKVCMLFLVPTTTGWNQMHMLTDPISIQFWLLQTKIYSSTKEYKETIDSTKTNSTPSKYHTWQQSLYVISCTYYYRMESIAYTYWPYISPVLTITYSNI